jgi:hypothetical protein
LPRLRLGPLPKNTRTRFAAKPSLNSAPAPEPIDLDLDVIGLIVCALFLGQSAGLVEQRNAMFAPYSHEGPLSDGRA